MKVPVVVESEFLVVLWRGFLVNYMRTATNTDDYTVFSSIFHRRALNEHTRRKFYK